MQVESGEWIRTMAEKGSNDRDDADYRDQRKWM